jgi:potassium efflux system protein
VRDRTKRRTGRRLRVTALALIGLIAAPAFGADAAPDPIAAEAADIGRRIERIQGDESLAAPVREQLLELYRRAETSLTRAQAARAETVALADAARRAPAESAALRATLAQLAEVAGEALAAETLHIEEETPVAVLDEQLVGVKAELTMAEARAEDVRARYEQEARRPQEARARLLRAQEERSTALEEREATAPPDETEAMTRARQAALSARTTALDAEIRKLEQELVTHAARLERLGLREALASNAVASTRTRVRLLEAALGERRIEAADQALADARNLRAAYADRPPVVRNLAERNADLSEEIAALASALTTTTTRDDELLTQARAIAEEFTTTRRKVELAGLSQALGRVLIERRRELPDSRSIRRERRGLESRGAEIGLRQIQLSEERDALADVPSWVAERTAALTTEDADAVASDLALLAANRRVLLTQAIESNAALLRAFDELERAQRQLISAVSAYEGYLSKRLMWIRYSAPISLALVPDLIADTMELVDPARWLRTATDLGQGIARAPLLAALALLAALLSLGRRRLLALVDAQALPLKRVSSDRFGATLTALGLTILAAAAIPGLVTLLARIVEANPDAARESVAIARGLQWAALEYFFLRAFTDLGRADGVAIRHFRWPAAAVQKLRRENAWLIVALPLGMFVLQTSVSLRRAQPVGGGESLGLVVLIVALGLAAFRLFHPEGGVLADYLQRSRNGLLARLRPLWVGALVATSPALLVLWFLGYGYTAGVLTLYLMHSAWFVFAIMILRALAIRWLLLIRRRLKLQAILDRMAATRDRKAEGSDAPTAASTASPDRPIDVEEPEVDLAALDADTRGLLNTGLLIGTAVGFWLIWSQVLPAFTILNDIALWTRGAVVDGEQTTVPVTLGDLLLAALVIPVTLTLARGLPSLLEFILLQRIAMTASARYTTDTLLRYLVIGIGIVTFFNVLGGSWSEIQWLVAALGVGIGFGLQEIVANFVSGLIILFERPIRVGDTVTVGETSGVVTRINIRATTIRDWDLKELVVPNKEFISNRLLNWTLSDPMTRVVITVGAAYGSDIERALARVTEAATEHPAVLAEPPPLVTFEGFGDSSLDIILRAYLPSGDLRLRTMSELRTAIYRKFAEDGITIAFPQRDVHLDLNQPLEVRIQGTTGDAPAS